MAYAVTTITSPVVKGGKGADRKRATTGRTMTVTPTDGTSILIDSNVFIAAESHDTPDGHVHGTDAATLLRLAAQLGFPVMVSHGTVTDFLQASPEVRTQRQRQLEKYHVLAAVPTPPGLQAAAGFPTALGPNDRADLEVLATLASGAAEWLVTIDGRFRKRATRAGYGDRVFSLTEALDTLNPLIAAPTHLPAVTVVKGYQVQLQAPIFDSLRGGYPDTPTSPGFNTWWQTKVAREHRDVVVLGDPRDPEGIAVLKAENDQPHGLPDRTLKICTFKVSDDFQGTKRGELLLKAVVDYARRNGHEHLYVEVFPAQEELCGWLPEFGFHTVAGATTDRGELVLHKRLHPDPAAPPLTPLAHHVAYGPGDALVTRAHVVPIRAGWHHKLLPEADPQGDLFAGTDACANAIRKAYLCHANTKLVTPGDVLLFYRTGTGASSVTAVGVVEQTLRSDQPAEIIRFVGSRTVYSQAEIRTWCAEGPVLAIRFRLDRVVAPPWPANTVRSNKVMNGTAQTIVRVPEEGLPWVRQQLDG